MRNKLFVLVSVILIAVLLLVGCSSPTLDSDDNGDPNPTEPVNINIAALKGPTGMGLVKLFADADAGAGSNTYNHAIYGTADEISAKLVNGELDIAAVPANLASVLYNRTEGKVQTAAVNTLGVLYVVENGDTISSVEDLRGKTIYSTGQGTTPEFALNYVLEQNGIDPQTDLTIEYKSESTEIAALLNETSEPVIAVLPQPYVTTVTMQNENVRVALDLTAEWDAVSADSSLVTGVIVVRAAFAEQNPEAFAAFLADYKASVEYVTNNTVEAAALIEQYDIAKAAVAQKALPYCNIVYIDGAEMKQALSGYLAVLHSQNTESVGGELPDDAFYYGA